MLILLMNDLFRRNQFLVDSFITRLSMSRFAEWECYKLSDCDFDKQCQGTPGRCIDPCTNNVDTGRPPCGVNADCVATRYKAICSCPKTHTGDPFVSCRPFTLADLCNPNPCGPNAFCEPGKDKRTGEDRPVCLCNEGYRGEKERLFYENSIKIFH